MLAFFYGTGGNGKGRFLYAISSLLGDYATSAPMDLLFAAQSERHPTEIADLAGRRLVTAIETEEGRRWSNAKVKWLTGGDRLKARFMRQDFFEFEPTHKLIVAGNYQPQLGNVDPAWRRRLFLVPFVVEIPDSEQDTNLDNKLREEWPAILSWAIDGCLAWQKEGLNPPSAVRAATEQYLETEDLLGQFIEDRCVVGRRLHVSSQYLFASWQDFCRVRNEDQGTMTKFILRLQARGYRRNKISGIRSVCGIGLRTEGRSSSETIGQESFM